MLCCRITIRRFDVSLYLFTVTLNSVTVPIYRFMSLQRVLRNSTEFLHWVDRSTRLILTVDSFLGKCSGGLVSTQNKNLGLQMISLKKNDYFSILGVLLTIIRGFRG